MVYDFFDDIMIFYNTEQFMTYKNSSLIINFIPDGNVYGEILNAKYIFGKMYIFTQNLGLICHNEHQIGILDQLIPSLYIKNLDDFLDENSQKSLATCFKDNVYPFLKIPFVIILYQPIFLIAKFYYFYIIWKNYLIINLILILARFSAGSYFPRNSIAFTFFLSEP